MQNQHCTFSIISILNIVRRLSEKGANPHAKAQSITVPSNIDTNLKIVFREEYKIQTCESNEVEQNPKG